MRTALVSAAALLCACSSGKSVPDAGPDGGPARQCAALAPPASSAGAPKRFATPQPIPLPAGRTWSSSPLSARVGGNTVAAFEVNGGVGVAVGGASPFSGSTLLVDQADTPALALVGTRLFVGWRAAGALTVGIADDAASVLQLGAGRGRSVQVPVPAGASAPSQLVLAASAGGEVFAAYTAAVAGARTQVFVSRMPSAGCAACTLQFEPAVPAGPGTQSEELPRLAAGRTLATGANLAVSFVRPSLTGASQIWVAQGLSGAAALSVRPLLVAESAAEEPAPLAYFSDGSLALAYGRLTSTQQSDAGPAAVEPEVADVVVRRLSQDTASAAVQVNDDPPSEATHWLPGISIDVYDRLWLAWYDTRFASPGDAAWGPGPQEPARAGACTAAVMFTRSDDQGATFKPNGLVTPDAQSVPFDPVQGSLQRVRAPLGPVTVTATDTELHVGYTDVVAGTGRAQLAEGFLP